MLVVHRRWWQVAVVLGLTGFAPSAAFAAGWADDFNDGSIAGSNPTWITNLGEPHNTGNFPGSYDPTSGDFVLTPLADEVETSQMSALVPIGFADTYIRAQGTVLPDPNNPANIGGNLVLTVRVDTTTLSGYLMYFDVGGNLNLQLFQGPTTADIGITYDAPFTAASEVVIELNAVGNQLNGFVWEASDPNGKPAEPQVTATITDFEPVINAGIAGIAYAEDDDGTIGVFRYVKAQDTPFIDVDPSNGDFDGDGDVDGADFLTWQRGLGLTGQPDATTGDSDDDGDVDAADLALWQSHFGGAPAVAAIGAVPEPASLALLAAGGMAIGGIRWRRRRS
jgi:hypothetical protein